MRKHGLSVLVAVIVSLLGAGSALAGGPVREPAPSDPLILDGDENPLVCPFPVRFDVERNKATIKTFANGRQFGSGSYWVRVTDLRPGGRSITFNNSGPITLTPNADGSLDVKARGQSLFYFFDGDLGGARLLRMTGLVRETLSADNVVVAFSHSGGTTENLCETLN